ncbi:uncharacterized protein EI97DRAFT_431318 [Westerdykella ornata]|uniref:Uncharacterized protein n=1 Tax=Westerdykella ornata TaxID=318751 RepID=A0A6A6JS62_WESOR|nr:uncharacterized protein EI97DRAFT_431318 [Westerdykella ornata]KAF2279104.1 hypothetical protein EI97DRAFT_431318 [Westerdykella ornata]
MQVHASACGFCCATFARQQQQPRRRGAPITCYEGLFKMTRLLLETPERLGSLQSRTKAYKAEMRKDIPTIWEMGCST